jgi:hypothetical protein
MSKRSNKDRVLIALLEYNSIRGAAKACRLSEETIYRYLKDQDFVRNYREARRQTVETAISKLQAATSEAVETLERNLHCENPSVEVRTAQIILETAIKGTELIDILQRLERIENEHQKQA